MTPRRLALTITLALCAACAGKGVPTEEGDDGSGGAGGTMTGGRGGASAGAGGGGGTAGNGGAGGSGGQAGGGQGGSAGKGGAGGTNTGGAGGTNTGGAGAGGTGNAPVGDGSCNAPGILLCDDFESLAAGSEPAAPNWKPQPMWQQDRIKVDASQKHSGTRSISVVGASYAAQLIAAKASPAPDNRFFVRVWMRLEKSTKDMNGHVSFIEGAEAEGDNGEELRLGASHGIVDVNLIPGSKGTGGGEKTQFSNGDVDTPRTGGGLELAANRWYCVEALFDGKAHEFRAWVDGTELGGMHVTDWKQGRTNWSPTYTFVKIGGQNFSGTMGRVFYDDVAIGTQRIGCGS